MTELLFRDDAYLPETARPQVRRASMNAAASCSIARCSTPTAGGQPGDTGALRRRRRHCRSPPPSMTRQDSIVHVPAEARRAAGSRHDRERRARLGPALPHDAHAHLPASAVRRGALPGHRRPDRRTAGRLDFDIAEAVRLDKDELDARAQRADRRAIIR